MDMHWLNAAASARKFTHLECRKMLYFHVILLVFYVRFISFGVCSSSSADVGALKPIQFHLHLRWNRALRNARQLSALIRITSEEIKLLNVYAKHHFWRTTAVDSRQSLHTHT